MNEPKIYSISTVGILKHFNQDYLLHPLRTDFTGGNGVGKSIIADLIQMVSRKKRGKSGNFRIKTTKAMHF